MNLGQRKIHLWRASATLLHCTIATGTPPSVLRPCFPGSIRSTWSFPQLGPDFWVGVVARLKGDESSARAAFMRARAQQEEEIRAHPDNVALLAELGLIDAGLGRKEEALNEGRRAMELASSAKDECTEPYAKIALPSSVPGQANANWRLGNLKPSPKLRAPTLMATCA